MLSVEVDVPHFRPVIRNEGDVIAAMTRRLLGRVKERTAAGRGVENSLPTPKDGGRPMFESGRLVASIGMKISASKNGRIFGVVRPIGDRPKEEQASIKKKKRAAAKATRTLRAVESFSRFAQSLSGQAPILGKRRSLSRIRKRTVIDNGSLAAILSVPPKDPNGIKGSRVVYRVFEASDAEQAEMASVARSMIHVDLEEVP